MWFYCDSTPLTLILEHQLTTGRIRITNGTSFILFYVKYLTSVSFLSNIPYKCVFVVVSINIYGQQLVNNECKIAYLIYILQLFTSIPSSPHHVYMYIIAIRDYHYYYIEDEVNSFIMHILLYSW